MDHQRHNTYSFIKNHNVQKYSIKSKILVRFTNACSIKKEQNFYSVLIGTLDKEAISKQFSIWRSNIIFFKYIETKWWTINQEPIEIWRIEYLVVREQKLRLD